MWGSQGSAVARQPVGSVPARAAPKKVLVKYPGLLWSWKLNSCAMDAFMAMVWTWLITFGQPVRRMLSRIAASKRVFNPECLQILQILSNVTAPVSPGDARRVAQLSEDAAAFREMCWGEGKLMLRNAITGPQEVLGFAMNLSSDRQRRQSSVHKGESSLLQRACFQLISSAHAVCAVHGHRVQLQRQTIHLVHDQRSETDPQFDVVRAHFEQAFGRVVEVRCDHRDGCELQALRWHQLLALPACLFVDVSEFDLADGAAQRAGVRSADTQEPIGKRQKRSSLQESASQAAEDARSEQARATLAELSMQLPAPALIGLRADTSLGPTPTTDLVSYQLIARVRQRDNHFTAFLDLRTQDWATGTGIYLYDSNQSVPDSKVKGGRLEAQELPSVATSNIAGEVNCDPYTFNGMYARVISPFDVSTFEQRFEHEVVKLWLVDARGCRQHVANGNVCLGLTSLVRLSVC